jgi:hypothetical protein
VRRVGRIALACVLCMAGTALAADDAALRVVEACRAKLDARVDVGIERIQKRCTDLLPALEKAPWHDLLPRAMRERREEISAESLGALVELVRASSVDAPRRAAPARATLDPVLAALGKKGQEGVTRWERFKRWLKQKLEARDKDVKSDWREEWLRKLRTSEGVAQAITYVGYALVGLLVTYVVWMELRAAGVLGAGRRSARRNGPAAEWRRRLMLADVLAAPLSARPGMLLQLLGEALARARRLPAAAGLTAGAIARRARLETTADRDELADVARVADAVRYAPYRPDDAALERTVDEARELLARFAKLPPERE